MQPGTQLGHYEITDLLGKGGMGEVYRARDTKLGREVAIKILPREFSQDEERLARLEREARMLAALNHPNIAAIHGLEESDHTRFLVLELVEGDTLADRLKRGAIPIEESLTLGLQIAEALEAAHEKGVIHRDLKPANIKVTPEGRVKVLDFGLAKAFIGDQADVNLSNSPTLSMAATQAGLILGTAAYMSPEQASGEVADHRADVWAFGVVLFEMLTGRQLFTGKTAAHVMGAVLNVEPDWDALPSDLHFRVRTLLERLLEKESKDRLSGISDARVEIRRVLEDPNGVLVQPASSAQTGWNRRLWTAVVATALVVGTGVWWLKPAPVPASEDAVRFKHRFAEGLRLRNPNRPAVAVSPDGRRVVYNTTAGLFLLDVAEFEARLVPGTQGNLNNVMFSPDGEWIGYYSLPDRQLKKISVNGGASVPLADVESSPFGASWGIDDTILYSDGGSIMRVSGSGGMPTAVWDVPTVRGGYPVALSDTGAVMFVTSDGFVTVQRLDDTEPRVTFPGEFPQYLTIGHIVFKIGDALYLQEFDLENLEVVGGPVPLIEDVGQFTISDAGTLAYLPSSGVDMLDQRVLVWADRQGTEEPIDVPPRTYAYVQLSPDDTRVALDIRDEDNDIWILDLERGTIQSVTRDEGLNRGPVWTPDGTKVAFSRALDGSEDIYWRNSDGSGDPELLVEGSTGPIQPSDFSPDGEYLLYEPSNADYIGMVRLEDRPTQDTSLLDDIASAESSATVSPDGRWLAYRSNESGQDQVYVRPFPDTDAGLFQVSTEGGIKPLWSRDGSELFYFAPEGGEAWSPSGAVMAVTVEADSTFSASAPEMLFEGPYGFPLNGRQIYDVALDGERFLMTRPANANSGVATPEISIVLDWFEELRGRESVP